MPHGHQSLLEAFQHLISTRPKEKVLMVPNMKKSIIKTLILLSINMLTIWSKQLEASRNSEPALIHLLKESKSHILIYDSRLSKISKSAQNELGSQHSQARKIFQLPSSLKNENIDYFKN
ncbi:hypothetical protein C2G38_2217423 [Gigaspora rosea]|uniref:Uncharacterized protein n=1 Tax=Gigaspora rosea TaxID=44941 RepID=A0A397U812_9GLOM|nr:hypothetical protein C2G38_2217423 [Gigaspora rosea]